jgi:hypothetical protein
MRGRGSVYPSCRPKMINMGSRLISFGCEQALLNLAVDPSYARVLAAYKVPDYITGVNVPKPSFLRPMTAPALTATSSLGVRGGNGISHNVTSLTAGRSGSIPSFSLAHGAALGYARLSSRGHPLAHCGRFDQAEYAGTFLGLTRLLSLERHRNKQIIFRNAFVPATDPYGHRNVSTVESCSNA